MSSPTPAQVEALLNFLMEHRDLARGVLRSADGRVRSHQLWENISTTLNAMGGCIKTTKQWQKVWTDKKYLAKKAAAAARRSASTTGGGPSTAPQLSHWESIVISIMGDGFGDPQTTARVPAYVERIHGSLSEPNAASSQTQHEGDLVQYGEEQQHTEPESQPDLPQSQRVSQICQDSAIPHTPRDQTPRTKRPRTIRRLIREDGSVRERLFRYEGTRNEELAGIKMAVLEHCRLMQQLIESKNEELGGLRTAFQELIGLMRQIMQQPPRND